MLLSKFEQKNKKFRITFTLEKEELKRLGKVNTARLKIKDPFTTEVFMTKFKSGKFSTNIHDCIDHLYVAFELTMENGGIVGYVPEPYTDGKVIISEIINIAKA